jgi:hypothetical protein
MKVPGGNTVSMGCHPPECAHIKIDIYIKQETFNIIVISTGRITV